MVMALSPTLKIARIRAGAFQRDIAQAIGITSNAYAQIENGTRTTTGKTAKAICKYLSMSFDDIFTITP